MDPDRQKRSHKETFLIKEVLEGAEHDAIAKQDDDGAYTTKKAHDKSEKGDLDIIKRYSEKHLTFFHLLIDLHGVTFIDIFLRLIDIGISEDDPGEVRVRGCRERTYRRSYYEDGEAHEQRLTRSP